MKVLGCQTNAHLLPKAQGCVLHGSTPGAQEDVVREVGVKAEKAAEGLQRGEGAPLEVAIVPYERLPP